MDISTILISVFSSAVISTLVSVILGNILENRRALQDRKLSFYLEFLEQLYKIVPEGVLDHSISGKALIGKVQIESAKLEKYVWKIKLIAKERGILESLDRIFNLVEELSEGMGEEVFKNEQEIMNLFDKINSERENLIEQMNKDCRKVFFRV